MCLLDLEQAAKCDARLAAEDAGLTAQEEELKDNLSVVEEQLREAHDILQAVVAMGGGMTPEPAAASSDKDSRKRKAA